MEQFEAISVEQAHSRLTSGEAVMVDIRDPQSFGAAHAPGAFHLSNDSLPAFIQQADAKCRRLTATGFRFGTYVLPVQDGRQCCGLYRRHFGIPQFVEVGQLFSWQRQGRKRNCAHGNNSYIASGKAALRLAGTGSGADDNRVGGVYGFRR